MANSTTPPQLRQRARTPTRRSSHASPTAESGLYVSVPPTPGVTPSPEEVAKWPHLMKNVHVAYGLRKHERWSHTVEHVVSLTAETANVYTALLQGVLAWWVHVQASYLPPEAAEAVWYFELAATLLGIGMVCITTYHVACSYGPVYHVVSALDLLGINVTVLGMAAILAGAGAPMGWMQVVVAEEATFIAFMAIAGAFGAAVFTYRANKLYEAPLWLILVNGLPAITVVFEYGMWSTSKHCPLAPEAKNFTQAAALLGTGFALYRLKWPEALLPWRLWSYVGSHSLWHVVYTVSISMLAYDGLQAAAITAARQVS